MPQCLDSASKRRQLYTPICFKVITELHTAADSHHALCTAAHVAFRRVDLPRWYGRQDHRKQWVSWTLNSATQPP
jgi:hypothetical protein